VETSERKIIQTAWPAEDMPASQELRPAQDFVCYLRDYAQKKPGAAAITCLIVGFVLGWKLKFW